MTASKAYGEAVVQSNEPQVQELVALSALISRMGVLVLAANCRVR